MYNQARLARPARYELVAAVALAEDELVLGEVLELVLDELASDLAELFEPLSELAPSVFFDSDEPDSELASDPSDPLDELDVFDDSERESLR